MKPDNVQEMVDRLKARFPSIRLEGFTDTKKNHLKREQMWEIVGVHPDDIQKLDKHIRSRAVALGVQNAAQKLALIDPESADEYKLANDKFKTRLRGERKDDGTYEGGLVRDEEEICLRQVGETGEGMDTCIADLFELQFCLPPDPQHPQLPTKDLKFWQIRWTAGLDDMLRISYVGRLDRKADRTKAKRRREAAAVVAQQKPGDKRPRSDSSSDESIPDNDSDHPIETPRVRPARPPPKTPRYGTAKKQALLHRPPQIFNDPGVGNILPVRETPIPFNLPGALAPLGSNSLSFSFAAMPSTVVAVDEFKLPQIDDRIVKKTVDLLQRVVLVFRFSGLKGKTAMTLGALRTEMRKGETELCDLNWAKCKGLLHEALENVDIGNLRFNGSRIKEEDDWQYWLESQFRSPPYPAVVDVALD